MTTSPQRLTISADDSEGTIRLEGELDAHTAPELAAALEQLDAGSPVKLDVSKVAFIDSSGLRVLLASHKRLHEAGERLTLISPSVAVVRLLDITGLSGHLFVQ